jgi:hypothetical protein
MGGSSDALDRAKAKCTNQALVTATEPTNLVAPVMYCEDTLTRIRFSNGPKDPSGQRAPGEFSGLEYYDLWQEPFRARIHSARDMVSSWDDPENVDKAKRDVQIARIINSQKAQAKKPEEQRVATYSEHMDFDDAGIFNMQDPDGVSNRFNLTALSGAPRVVQKRLREYLVRKLQETFLPEGLTFYFEYSHEGPWKMEGVKPLFVDVSLAHGHGEGDPSQAYWLEKLCFHAQEGETAIIYSKDQDVIYILLHCITRQARYFPAHYVRRPIYWIRESFTGPRHNRVFKREVFDMRIYYSYVLMKEGMTECQYMLACVLSGNGDYLPKKLLTNQLGFKDIMASFYTVREYFDVWDQLTSPHGDRPDLKRQQEELDAVILFVRQVYHDKLVGFPNVVKCKNNLHVTAREDVHTLVRLREIAAGTKYTVPSDEDIQGGYLLLSTTFWVWRDRSKWPKDMFGVPDQEGKAKRFDQEPSDAVAPDSGAAAAAASSSAAAAAAASAAPAASSYYFSTAGTPKALLCTGKPAVNDPSQNTLAFVPQVTSKRKEPAAGGAGGGDAREAQEAVKQAKQ